MKKLKSIADNTQETEICRKGGLPPLALITLNCRLSARHRRSSGNAKHMLGLQQSASAGINRASQPVNLRMLSSIRWCAPDPQHCGWISYFGCMRRTKLQMPIFSSGATCVRSSRGSSRPATSVGLRPLGTSQNRPSSSRIRCA